MSITHLAWGHRRRVASAGVLAAVTAALALSPLAALPATAAETVPDASVIGQKYGAGVPFTEYFNTKLHGGMVQAGNTVTVRDPDNPYIKAMDEAIPGNAELSKTFDSYYERTDSYYSSNGDKFYGEDGTVYQSRATGKNFAANPAPGMLNSSSANITVPAGSTVKKALLVWNGCEDGCWEITKDVSENPVYHKGLSKDRVKFRGPGGTWSTVKADAVYNEVSYPHAPAQYSKYQGRFYSAHADVTDLVKGSGTYSAGDLSFVDEAWNTWGGWHLVVVYEKASEPLRQVVINRGIVPIGPEREATIKIPAIDFPQSGPFAPKVFLGGSDGDPAVKPGEQASGADYFEINGVRQGQGALRSATNFWTSAITDANGTNVASRTPAYPNAYGTDIVELDSPSAITRTTKGITLSGKTEGEGIHPYLFALQVEINNPKLSITKDDKRTEVLPGEELSYTLTVKNTGAGDEAQARVTDQLPAELEFVSASDGGAVDEAGKVSFPAFSLAAGATKTLTVKAKVKTDVARPGKFTNFATVAGYGDPDPKCETPKDASDHCTTDTDTIPGADVKILKEHVAGAAVKGETLTWKVTVGNDGKADARDVVVTDKLPESVDPATLTGTDPSQGEWAKGQWNVGTLKAGATASITLSATVAKTVPAGQHAGVNEARVTSPDDPTPTDPATCQDNTTLGEDTDNCDVVPLPKNPSDLSLTKDDGVEVVEPEQKLTYTIEVTNEGPGDESAATVTDLFPAELDFVSASNGGALDAKTGLITFKDLAIKAGEKKALTVVATVKKDIARPTKFTNYAAVTGTDVPPADPSTCKEGDKRCDTDTDTTVPEPTPTPEPSDPPATPSDPVEPPLANTGMSSTTGVLTGLGTLALVGGALAAGLARRHRKEAAAAARD